VIADAATTTEHSLSVRPDALDSPIRNQRLGIRVLGHIPKPKPAAKTPARGDICTPRRILTYGGPTKGQANNESRLEVPPSRQLLGRILLEPRSTASGLGRARFHGSMADDRPYSARKRDCSLWKIRVKNNKWPSESNSATLPTPPALKARARVLEHSQATGR
jgi:hypothetical protein